MVGRAPYQRDAVCSRLRGVGTHSADVSEGQKLFKRVYEILRKSPLWNDTLLLITYDEHGGFYDHVPTPLDGIPNPDGLVSEDPPFTFDRLGVRVPTVAISPWIPKGLVVHEPTDGPTPTSHYDHASIPATIRKLFNISEPLTARDAWSAPFDHILSLSEPRTDCPMTMPDVPFSLRHQPQDGMAPVTELQKEFVLLASSLNEPDPTKAYNGEGMNALEAARYIRDQVNKFFGRNMYPPNYDF